MGVATIFGDILTTAGCWTAVLEVWQQPLSWKSGSSLCRDFSKKLSKGLISRSLGWNLCRIFFIPQYPFHSTSDRIFLVSFILFHYKACRFLKTPRFRKLRMPALNSASLRLIFSKREAKRRSVRTSPQQSCYNDINFGLQSLKDCVRFPIYPYGSLKTIVRTI